MAFATLHYEKRGGVAHVVLNRPQVLNAMNVQMRDDLSEVLPAILADDEVRVVIFSGAGRAFCAGADVSEFGTAPSPTEARKVRLERDNWGMLAYFEKPTIAAMHGYALGAGLELAMLCDIRVASERTMFGLPEVPLGMIPGAGGSQTIGRTALRGHALQMLLTGERLDSQEAYSIGLINRIAPLNGHLASAEALADRLLSNAPLAIKLAKQAVLLGLDSHLKEGLALEQSSAKLLTHTRDFRTGLRSAQGGRRPRFIGR